MASVHENRTADRALLGSAAQYRSEHSLTGNSHPSHTHVLQLNTDLLILPHRREREERERGEREEREREGGERGRGEIERRERGETVRREREERERRDRGQGESGGR